MKVFVIFAIVSVTLISVGLIQPVSSQAMCAGDKTLEDQYQEYDYIFSGKVSEIQPNPVRGKITLTVYEMWKGQPSESITILSGVGESDYSIPFEMGNSYLVFASKLVFDEPVTSGCSPTKPLINASNEIEFLNTKTESKTINFQYPAPGSSIVANLYSLKTQIEYGLSYDQLRCNEGHVLIQKYDGSPACVTESTKTKLIERGWTTQSQNKIEYQVLSKDKILSKGTGFDLPEDTFTEDELRELEQHEKELRKILVTEDLPYEERNEIVNEINSMQDRLQHPFQTGVPYNLVKMIKERYSVIDVNFSELRKEVYFSGSSSQISHQYQALRIGIHPDHFSLPELKQQDQTIREYLGDEMNILYEKVLVVPSDEN